MTVSKDEYIERLKKAKKKRQGNCFSLAGQYVMDHKDSVLVHGVAAFMPHLVDIPFDHAWVELADGKIWEPITEMTMTAKEWESIARPVYWSGRYEVWAGLPTRYDHQDLLARVRKEETWGPWHDIHSRTTRDST